MWVADQWKEYRLLDTSDGERLETWGKYILVRPDPQVIWSGEKKHPAWKSADASYRRSHSGGGAWSENKLPESWTVKYKNLTFRIKPMGFKHTGLFPEQATNWDWFSSLIRNAGRPIRVLNLFAYTGGATVAAAAAGASVSTWTLPAAWCSRRRKTPFSRGLAMLPSAISWTTVGSSSKERSVGAINTMASSWTRPLTAEAPRARFGN